MKLEVGMYCYNKTNRKMGIGKIISFQSNNNINVRYKNDIELASIGNLEASFNIIDILKVEDYVNGHKIKSKQSGVKRIDIGEDENYVWLYENNIKSVITHEQMEQMSYRIGE